jgi:hypothetical protein
MTEFDEQRIVGWVSEAFAILCVRAGGGSVAEKKVRLGFESILRQLGTPPLRIIARSMPPLGRVISASSGDWRQIINALERSLAIFDRYEALVTPAQRRTRELVAATRQFAHEELRARANGRLSGSASPRLAAQALEAGPSAQTAAASSTTS